jgi:hypothetical protein
MPLLPMRETFEFGKPTATVTWQSRLDTAASIPEIVSAARDFLASLSPEEMDSLPEACKPPSKLVDIDDVNSYALDLMRHQCAESSAGLELMEQLCAFFSNAATRSSRLLAYRNQQIERRQSAS